MNPIPKHSSFYKYVFLGWLILILAVSSIPKLPNPNFEIRNRTLRVDYLIHWLEYLILTGLFVLWRSLSTGKHILKTGLLALILGLCVGTIDEIHQLLIPGRIFNPLDMIHNYLGVITGIFLGSFYAQRFLSALANKKITTGK